MKSGFASLLLAVVLLAASCTGPPGPAPTARVIPATSTAPAPVILETATVQPPGPTKAPSPTPTRTEVTATFTPLPSPEPTQTEVVQSETWGRTIYLPMVTISETPVVFIGAGDMGDCEFRGGWMTAGLLDQYPEAALFTVGDNVQHDGTTEEYEDCFDPTWGRHKARIRPAIGNHELVTDSGAPYYAYFGAAAGEPGIGYYSYNLGQWHILVINSNLTDTSGAAMEEWVRADLVENPTRCALAYWHHPRFNSGWVGNADRLIWLWSDLYTAGVDVVINGHDHHYERFAPQDPYGTSDPQRGIRQFIAGTGGSSLSDVEGEPIANSEVIITNTYGVLKFLLYSDRYEWAFLSAETGEALDTGVDFCR